MCGRYRRKPVELLGLMFTLNDQKQHTFYGSSTAHCWSCNKQVCFCPVAFGRRARSQESQQDIDSGICFHSM
eukprot:10674-Heterococcus_DN1.PRE.1